MHEPREHKLRVLPVGRDQDRIMYLAQEAHSRMLGGLPTPLKGRITRFGLQQARRARFALMRRETTDQ